MKGADSHQLRDRLAHFVRGPTRRERADRVLQGQLAIAKEIEDGIGYIIEPNDGCRRDEIEVPRVSGPVARRRGEGVVLAATQLAHWSALHGSHRMYNGTVTSTCPRALIGRAPGCSGR